MDRIDVTLRCVPLTVVGCYVPAEKKTSTYPGAESNFEVAEIYVADIAVTDVFDPGMWEELVSLCCSEIEKNRADSEDDCRIDAWLEEQEVCHG